MGDIRLFICIEQVLEKWLLKPFYYSQFEKYSSVIYLSINKNKCDIFKRQIVCLNDDKRWLLDSVTQIDFLAHFLFGTLTRHRLGWNHIVVTKSRIKSSTKQKLTFRCHHNLFGNSPSGKSHWIAVW